MLYYLKISFCIYSASRIHYIGALHKSQILDSKLTLPTRLSNKAKNSYTHKLRKV